MKNLRLLFKLALLPLKRSWFLLGLLTISFSQLMLALWFCGSVQKELELSRNYASKAKFVTVQMKDNHASTSGVKEAFQLDSVSIEELKTEDVLKKMEEEEPELVQTIRSLETEGLGLVPKIVIVQGLIPEEVLEKVKLMTEVSRVDQSPVHHARLQGFYKHLAFEIRISVLMILFLALVQLLVFQRIQSRDSAEVSHNLLAWGVSSVAARLPGFLSMISLNVFSLLLSVVEWFSFRAKVWKNNSFLGELSLDHSLSFPAGFVFLTLLAIVILSLMLSFSGKAVEE